MLHIPHTKPLYHPHTGEIRPLIQTVIDRHPQLRSRALAAETILANLDLRDYFGSREPLTGDWQVKSQNVTKKDHWYYIDYNGNKATCHCADFGSGIGRAAGRTFCKHSIAWLTYRMLLTHRLNYHIQSRNIAIEYLKNSLLLDAPKLGMVKVERDEPYLWWKFADVRSMAIFAHWLGGRQAEGAEPAAIEAKRETLRLDADRTLAGEIYDAGIMDFAEWKEHHPCP